MLPFGELGENCLSCAVGFTINFSSMFGIPCIKLDCFHSAVTNKFEISYSKFRICTASFLALCFVTNSIYCTYLMTFAINNKDEVILVKLLTTSLLCLRSVLTVLVGLIKADVAKKVVLQVNDLLKVSRSKQFGILLPNREVRRLRIQSMLLCALSILLLNLFGMYLFMADNIYSEYLLFEKLTFLCFTIDSSILLLFWGAATLFAKVHHEYRQKIKIKMLKRYCNSYLKKTYVKQYKPTLNDDKVLDLCESLTFSRRLQTKLFLAFRDFNKFCNSVVVIWLLITITVIVTNMFFTLMAIANGNTNLFLPEFIGLELQLFFSVTSVIYCVNSIEELKNTVRFLIFF